MKNIFWRIISIYRLTRLALSGLGIPLSSCRFVPSCSEYTYEAICQYGTIQGLLKGAKRILRCHPGARSGCDPVKQKHD